MHIKGHDVVLLLDGKPVAGSTSCSMTITANTADGASKSSDDPYFDDPEFMNYSWSMQNESFIVNTAALASILNNVISGDASFAVNFGLDGVGYIGNAIVSSLTVDAANGDYAKLSLSLEGNGTLSKGSIPFFSRSATTKVKGKTLMISIGTGSGYNVWKTIACASSHKLTVSLNLSDITDKDYNDTAAYKEITGRSVSLSTENLIDVDETRGVGIEDLTNSILIGEILKLTFGYHNASGRSIHERSEDNGWGEATTALVTGSFLCTSVQANGAVKDNATFSADFQSKGAVTAYISGISHQTPIGEGTPGQDGTDSEE